MATNPNENGSYEVVHATRWSIGGRGEQKTRLVVLKFRDTNKSAPYAVRLQTPSGDNGPTFSGGAYKSMAAAHDAMLKEYFRNNSVFKKGNVSNFPGIAK